MELVKVKFKSGWALAERGKIGQSRADVGLKGVWELYGIPAEADSTTDIDTAEAQGAHTDMPISLADLTKADLIKIAERGGLSVTDRMTKQQIADLITAHGAGD